MTNPINPPAEPALGSPNIFTSDLMNSLKRLERVGDENSKTTQKLISAAADVSKAVATLLADLPDGAVVVPSPFVRVGDTFRNRSPWCEYFIEAGKLMFRRPSGPQYVAEDREAAFAFSKDVHSGLIYAIAANLAGHDRRGLGEDLLATLHWR